MLGLVLGGMAICKQPFRGLGAAYDRQDQRALGNMMTFDANQLCCRPIQHGSPEYDACVVQRNAVLRKPLGLLLTAAEVQAEHSDHHLACYLDGRLLGCLVLTPEAEGKVISCGRRVGTAEGKLTDKDGRILAHGTTTCLIFEH